MTIIRMTDKWITSLRVPRGGKRVSVTDGLCKGLHLRITPHGTKTFCVMVRPDPQQKRRQHRVTLGEYPALSLAEARRQALRVQRDAAESRLAAKPVTEAPASALPTPVGMTYSELVENYDRLHLRPNLKSGPNILASLKQPVLHHLFDQGAGNVTKRDLVAAADTLRDANKPHAAANMLKAQRAMYNWAVDRGDVEANPCEGMRQPRTAAARERTLTDQEIAAVLGACDRVPAPFGAVVRVLLHTGARRNEVAQMRWSELDGNVWTLPAARSKSGRANSLPLPPAVMAVIDAQARPADGGDGYVFSTTDGARPSSDFSKRKRLLDEASEVTGWRLHDLRRTARSLMAKLGVDREVARRVVGHSVDQLDAIYDRHDYVKEKEHALSIVAEYLAHAELRSESTLFV